MKKLPILLLLLILGTGGWFYLSIPEQVRLNDEDLPPPQPTEAEIKKKEDAENLRINPNILVYYFATSDTACETPVPTHFEDLDQRVKYQEINALYALLTHTLPPNVKNPIITGTEINSFKIADEVARVDLNVFLGIGKEPCGPQARKKQLIMTLKQFKTIKSVSVYSDGKLIP